MKNITLILTLAVFISGCIDDGTYYLYAYEPHGIEPVHGYVLPDEDFNLKTVTHGKYDNLSCFDDQVLLTNSHAGTHLEGTIPASLLPYNDELTTTEIICTGTPDPLYTVGDITVIDPYPPVIDFIDDIVVASDEKIIDIQVTGQYLEDRGTVFEFDGYMGDIKVDPETGNISGTALITGCDLVYSANITASTLAGSSSQLITISITGDDSITCND